LIKKLAGCKRGTELIVDAEFKSLIPPLTEEEYELLEQSIIAEGCRDALVIWNGTLLDGHNRYEMCQKHGIDFDTKNIELKDRDTAKIWIIDNQLARRNLSLIDRGKLELRRARIIEKRVRERQGTRTDLMPVNIRANWPECSQSSTPEERRSRKEIGEELGISGRQYQRLKKILEHTEILEGEGRKEEAEKIENELRNNEKTVHGVYKEIQKQDALKEVEEKSRPDYRHEPIIRRQDAKTLLSILPADLVLTDPPYSTDVEDIDDFVSSWLPELKNSIGTKGRAFIFIGPYPEELMTYLIVLSDLNLLHRTQILIWSYKNTLGNAPKYRYKNNWQTILFIQSDPPIELDCPLTSEMWAVQEMNAPDARTGERYHRWEKPIELVKRLIRHTTKKDELVVDPFSGSGTTLLAAAELGRRSMGGDIDDEAIIIACKRGCVLCHDG